MAVSKEAAKRVRFNDLDWALLEVLSDGRRYTPKHLYTDVAELDQWSDDYIRQELGRLQDDGLVERVGSSSMYIITDLGQSALAVRDQITDEMGPGEVGSLVYEHYHRD